MPDWYLFFCFTGYGFVQQEVRWRVWGYQQIETIDNLWLAIPRSINSLALRIS